MDNLTIDELKARKQEIEGLIRIKEKEQGREQEDDEVGFSREYTVKELIIELQKYDGNLDVVYWSEEHGDNHWIFEISEEINGTDLVITSEV